jgi:hypothetical protein
LWVWSAIVCVCAHAALLTMLYRATRRAYRWELAAKVADADARIWQSVAERGESNVFSKRTIVAPQYHAPDRRMG